MLTVHGNSIEQLNPLTKIATVMLLGGSAIIWPDPWLGLCFMVVLFMVAAVAHLFGSFFKLMLGFGIPLTVMLMFMQGLYSPRNKTILADFGFAKLGLEGVMGAGKVIVVVLVFLGSFYLMNKTTEIGCLVSALNAIGFPAKAGYLILASLNVVPQMQRRMSVISQAQSARGLHTSGSLFGRMKAIIPLLGPVVLSSLTDAQERGMTLETRGFGMKGIKRTNIIKTSWNRRDSVIFVILLGVFTLSLLISIGVYAGLIAYWGGVR